MPRGEVAVQGPGDVLESAVDAGGYPQLQFGIESVVLDRAVCGGPHFRVGTVDASTEDGFLLVGALCGDHEVGQRGA